MTKTANNGKMFEFITGTENPLGGSCPYGCTYCWTQGIKTRFEACRKKYQGKPFIDEKVLKKYHGSGEFIFVTDMRDLFSPDVSIDQIKKVFDWIDENYDSDFLLLTKNPDRYIELYNEQMLFLPNIILGVTIESNNSYDSISKAPSVHNRLYGAYSLSRLKDCPRIFISIEPILDFDKVFKNFAITLEKIRPWGVAIGYDNYKNGLPEPPLEKTLSLIESLEESGIKVYRKSLRAAI